jgi:NarL family two-component system sensor histidine kinase LiaS
MHSQAELVELLRKQFGNKTAAVVASPQGVVLASTSEAFLRPADRLSDRLSAADQAVVGSALSGEAAPSKLARRDESGGSFATTPIKDARGQTLGLLLVKTEPPLQADKFSRDMIGLVLLSGIIAGVFAAIVGTGFGFMTARRYTSRLQSIAAAANSWSSGDFKAAAEDTSKDEIGQLAQGLNEMAGKLQELVDLRQNLATAEERNRLARDLHDTVKQQIFATTMQIGAARALMQSDAGAAEARLMEAERQAYAAQQELTAILEQMRPGSYQRQGAAAGLEQMLRSTIADWSRQSGIAAAVQCEALPEIAEAQQRTVLRILQEALSNIARHSAASRVRVEARGGGRVSLVITDDGRGFTADNGHGGMGLRNMRERSESLPGGTFSVSSEAGQGTRLEITFSADEGSQHE